MHGASGSPTRSTPFFHQWNLAHQFNLLANLMTVRRSFLSAHLGLLPPSPMLTPMTSILTRFQIPTLRSIQWGEYLSLNISTTPHWAPRPSMFGLDSITAPEIDNSPNAYRRLGETIARVSLSVEEEERQGDDLEMFLVELSAKKDTLDLAFVRPQPSNCNTLSSISTTSKIRAMSKMLF